MIPTHNRPAGLREAVKSVLAQDVAEAMVVVVDDGSIPPVSNTFCRLDPPLVVLRNELPKGPAAARNQGVDAVNSNFVAFLDDDDQWLPGKLRACLSCFDRYPEAGAVVHRTAFRGARGSDSGGDKLIENPVRRMLTHQPPHVDGVLIRREVHDAVRFDETFPAAADLDYMLRIAMAAPVVELERVYAVREPAGSRISAIALERRLAGRRRFREKHRELFDAEAEAFYELRLGHLLRRAGYRRAAAAAFARSLRLRPVSKAPWKGLATLALSPGLVERFVGVEPEA